MVTVDAAVREARVFTTARAVAVIVITLVVTTVLGLFASQSEFADGVGVDNEVSAALDVLEERFADRTSVLQVVVESNDGADVRNADALTAGLDLREAIEDGPLADTLAQGPQPPIVGFLAGAEAVVGERGLDPDDLDDDEVRRFDEEGRQFLPEEASAQVDQLVEDDEPPTVGLILVFQDTTDLDEDEQLAQQADLADLVADLDTSDGIDLSPLSLPLLLEGDDVGGEIGRLFGTAMAIILAVLAVVYWMRPESGRRARVVRRTLADVGLTLLVILFAVVWMQGLGVLLGPDYLGWIGYFSNQTQVVPILIVGLGVDFSIHLLARYRSETGTDGDPRAGFGRAAATVGIALLLDTAATAIGFLTNLVSPVEFLATLGVLAALGITAAFVLTMTFLPAIRVLLDARAVARDRLPQAELASSDESALPRVIGRLAVLAERAPVAVLAVTVALTVAGGWGFTQLDSRFALTDFVPQDDPQLATFELVEDRFGGGFDETSQVLVTGDVATPEAHNALLDALERAAEVDGVETLDGAVDATSPVSVLQQAAGDEEVAEQLGDLGVQDDGSVADDADVEQLYAQLLEQVPTAEEVLHEGDDGWAARVELRTSVDQAAAQDLRVDLAEAFTPVADAGTEVVPASQQMLQASVSGQIEDAQLRSIAIALAAVMVLLALFFGWRQRRPGVGVLTVAPVVFVLAMTFGMMALTGIPLNPVTATLAALSIGIGVPFNIHVAARYLEEREDEGVESPLRRAVGRTGGAVVASALTTGIGFGVLITSTLLPFEQLGYVIVYAITWSAVAATVVLPSLLSLWERRQA